MSIYFDFETINELTGDNYYRKQREFTLDELAQYDGTNGNPAYVAIKGIVYDVSNKPAWSGGIHFGITAGKDLTEQFNSCHGVIEILNNAPKVGILIDDNDMSYMNFESTISMNRQTNQDTSKFTPDDWIRYITPLVTFALRQPNQEINNQQGLYQKVILLGVLVGMGKTPQEAINQLQEWQNTGASQLLSGNNGTGTGGVGTGVGTGTTGGTGTGGVGTGVGTGTTGGIGTGGVGTGVGAGTTGGTGTGGVGTGVGTGTTGGTGNGGVGTGTSNGGMTSNTGSRDRSNSTNTRNRLYFD